MADTKAPTAEQVMDALARGGTVAKAAALLGLSERTLYRRMDGFGIKVRRVPIQEAA
jgi:transcriptional regulator of acetoin/glycerol metabolism